MLHSLVRWLCFGKAHTYSCPSFLPRAVQS